MTMGTHQVGEPLYRQTGVVLRGDQFGRTIGFPTVNIALGSVDVSGTYAGEVVVGGSVYPAAVYADERRGLLEAHILDFDRTIYGEEIEIRLLKRIAETKHFENDDALRVFVADMVSEVRKYFLK